MDGGTVTGIIQCCLAGVAIGVDIFLAVIGGQFFKSRKEKKEKEAASEAINEGNKINTPSEIEVKYEQDVATVVVDKKLKKQAKHALNNLKGKHKNTYPEISAISFVIAFKKLYDGSESMVVKGLNIAKQKGYLTWSDERLLPGTIITIDKEKEGKLIDYFSSRKS